MTLPKWDTFWVWLGFCNSLKDGGVEKSVIFELI